MRISDWSSDVCSSDLHGESLRLEKLPAGRSRVLYPGEPLPALEDVDASIRHALDNPLGDSQPLRALLRPGMKLTIAFDDISLPLPPLRKPDVRQLVIEAVLDVAPAAGVDDVNPHPPPPLPPPLPEA